MQFHLWDIFTSMADFGFVPPPYPLKLGGSNSHLTTQILAVTEILRPVVLVCVVLVTSMLGNTMRIHTKRHSINLHTLYLYLQMNLLTYLLALST